MMTLFNALCSKSRIFKTLEPQKLLGKMTNRITPAGDMTSIIVGWLIHLLVGNIMSVMDQKIIHITSRNRKIYKSIIYGAFDGIIGVLGWKTAFNIHPDPPKIELKKYYLQLFISHLVFGFFHNVTTRYLNKINYNYSGSRIKSTPAVFKEATLPIASR